MSKTEQDLSVPLKKKKIPKMVLNPNNEKETFLSTYKMLLINQLQDELRFLDISQKAFAEKLSISKVTINYIVMGHSRKVSIDTLLWLCNKAGIDVVWDVR